MKAVFMDNYQAFGLSKAVDVVQLCGVSRANIEIWVLEVTKGEVK